MLSAFSNCLKIPELRNRILFTLAMIIVVRIGAAIPVPGVNASVLGEFFNRVVNSSSQGSLVGMFNLFSGGALENCAIFSLGVMPYISASIMMQLLVGVIPSLAKLAREDGGRQKISQYSRVLTLVLCVFQGYLLAMGFRHPDTIPFLQGIGDVTRELGPLVVDSNMVRFVFTTVLTLSTGTMILMWIGEQITDKGIGNGVSMIITIGIVARLPAAAVQGWSKLFSSEGGAGSPMLLIVILAFLLLVIAATVAMTQAVRKIIVQYAKQVRGNKIYGGQSSYLPLKVNYSGVMPLIFADAILLFFSTIVGLLPNMPWAQSLSVSLSSGSMYYFFYVGMILFFSYFWVATQFNPVQIAGDLKKNNGAIPGVRPGQPTADFLDFIMTRLTLAGAIFLTLLAIMPSSLQRSMGIPSVTAQFFGGTSLLIMVGVVLDTMRQAETYLLQRHYDGFLKKGKLRGRSAMSGGDSANVVKDETLIWVYSLIALAIIVSITLWAYMNR